MKRSRIMLTVLVICLAIITSACSARTGDIFSGASSDGPSAESYSYVPVDPAEYSKTKGEWDVTGLSLPSIFDDGMILQRDQAIHVYGESTNGTEVTVHFNNMDYTTQASPDNGSFIVTIPPCPAGRGLEMSVSSDGSTITYDDILIGDVFLCGGQSNMQLTMDDAEWYGDFYTSRFAGFADNPDIRQLLVEFGGSAEVQFDCATIGWKSATRDTFKKFAPLAYLFADRLQEELDIPVGLVMCSAGGSAIQLWMPADDQVYEEDSSSIFYEQKALLYNNMLAPLLPYSYAGVLWYQGEANASYDKAGTYEILLPRLISSWRRGLYDPAVPFYVMELAGYSDDRFAILREEQWNVCRSMDKVYLIPNFDLGSATDIHPKTKDILADRIMKTYLATKLGQPVAYKAPVVIGTGFAGDAATLTFGNVYDGLKADSDMVTGFALAGSDGIYHAANAVIAGKDKVRVTCPGVPLPVTVRYCFKGFTEAGNLYNSADIPPYPFRTDTAILQCSGTVLTN
ncbi:MAG: sialate O-acetylesterase [Saccharofermentanales bacterium]